LYNLCKRDELLVDEIDKIIDKIEINEKEILPKPELLVNLNDYINNRAQLNVRRNFNKLYTFMSINENKKYNYTLHIDLFDIPKDFNKDEKYSIKEIKFLNAIYFLDDYNFNEFENELIDILKKLNFWNIIDNVMNIDNDFMKNLKINCKVIPYDKFDNLVYTIFMSHILI
jgi:hypothetical protein